MTTKRAGAPPIQVYYLRTRFDFGKHQGKTLFELISMGGSKYVGWLIANRNPWFILHPETIEILNYHDFFNDLHMSGNVSVGSIPLREISLSKDDIMLYLKSIYEEYVNNPSEYALKAIRHFEQIESKKKFRLHPFYEAEKKLPKEDYDPDYEADYHPDYDIAYNSDYFEYPVEFGSSRDINENPWRNALPDDEADVAYWNTH